MNLHIPVFNPVPIPEHGPMGSTELVALTGSKMNTIREYMSKLVNEGRALSELIANPVNGGRTVMAIYSVGDGTIPQKGEVAKRETVTQYPLHHVRDSLVTALFGPAKQQHGDLTK
jgi:hypothetical protein